MTVASEREAAPVDAFEAGGRVEGVERSDFCFFRVMPLALLVAECFAVRALRAVLFVMVEGGMF